jgi:hypothetical protein
MRFGILCFVVIFFSFALESYSDQTLIAQKVEKPPAIDGREDASVWDKAKAITTRDKKSGIDVTIKALYTEKNIFFLASFADPDESRKHKCWTWDKKAGIYKQGLTREDVFVFKWALSPDCADLSVYSDSPSDADIWFWKACRTDPVGYADDKIQSLREEKLPKSRKIKSRSGKTMYLQRRGDNGQAAYKTTLHTEYKGDILPHFVSQIPDGSRADIRAKGFWTAGRWTIEFSRALQTGNNDDVQFDLNKKYLFGISRYEIAGRPTEPNSSQPLYGSGDISENLTLIFSGEKAKKEK